MKEGNVGCALIMIECTNFGSLVLATKSTHLFVIYKYICKYGWQLPTYMLMQAGMKN